MSDKKINECKKHPTCEGCKLSVLFNGLDKPCNELTNEEVKAVLEAVNNELSV